MPKLTLDITGFYYALTVEGGDAANLLGDTVKALTSFAVGKNGVNGGVLTRADFDAKGFLSCATVDFTGEGARPASRQQRPDGKPPLPNPPRGIYSYDDTISNVVAPGCGGTISFSLVWQYYIFGKNNVLKTGNAGTTVRTIFSAGNSNKEAPLEDGDRVVWRLVAIGGLKERVDRMNEANLFPYNKTQTIRSFLG
ncbi:MAG: hypothetical protein ACFB20_08195 [Opitutales bacterium]